MSDAIYNAVVWLDSASWGVLALVWLVASVAFGGLWAIACRQDRGERVRGLDHGEWY